MEYSDFLLTVLTLCALGLTVAVAIGSVRIASSLSRLDRIADRFTPELERTLAEARDALRSVERLTERAHEVAADAKEMSAATKRNLIPVIHQLSATGSAAADGLAHVGALVAATKVGLRALSRNGH